MRLSAQVATQALTLSPCGHPLAALSLDRHGRLKGCEGCESVIASEEAAKGHAADLRVHAKAIEILEGWGAPRWGYQPNSYQRNAHLIPDVTPLTERSSGLIWGLNGDAACGAPMGAVHLCSERETIQIRPPCTKCLRQAIGQGGAPFGDSRLLIDYRIAIFGAQGGGYRSHMERMRRIYAETIRDAVKTFPHAGWRMPSVDEREALYEAALEEDRALLRAARERRLEVV